jgi:DNA-binding XRE family transcriptional regulator
LLEGTEIDDLKNVKIIYVGLKGYHTQYKIENLDLLEEYRKSNVMTKKDMAKAIGVSLRLYESISYGNNINTRCAKKLKEFLNYA